MKTIKHLSEVNKLTFWYVTSASGFIEWWALFWENYRYFSCSSQNNLTKGEIFLCSVSKIINLKSLLKSALTGKNAFDISLWSCQSFILSSFCFSFDTFELLMLGVLKKFVKLGYLSLLVKYFLFFLTLKAPIPQNGQTHSNNSSAICQRIVLGCLTILWNWRIKG